MQQLADSMAWFTKERHIHACLCAAFGTADTERHLLSPGDEPLCEDTLFDLASLTKLFTGLTVLRLREEGLLDLSRPVTDYAPQFSRLADVSVETVLTFGAALRTPARVDAQETRAEGLHMLFQTGAEANGPGRIYSDMHAMVLKYVIEGATREPYFDCLHERILAPLGMKQTFAHVPEGLKMLAASCDGEHRVEGGRRILRRGVLRGTVHDPKARLLSEDGRDLCGHAGLFSTRGDMTRLCRGLLRGDVLSPESLRFMAQNRTGKPLGAGSFSQYLGCQCYVKHPQQHYSEIPLFMSDRAIGLSGFTGHHLSVDPETGVFVLLLGDRVKERLTVCPEGQRAALGLAPDGSGLVDWGGGEQVYSSVDWVHQKDERLHRHIGRLLGLPTWRRTGTAWE